jgi:hypothetical protein
MAERPGRAGRGVGAVAPADRGVFRVPIENKYAVIAAVAAFLVVLGLSHGSLFAAFGALALIAGLGWAARKLFGRG